VHTRTCRSTYRMLLKYTCVRISSVTEKQCRITASFRNENKHNLSLRHSSDPGRHAHTRKIYFLKMASPFVPFSGGDFLPPAPTSGGVADDGPPPCSRCGFGGCDLRVAGCGCLLHTVSTPAFSLPRRNWYKSYVLLFFRRI
jgi:hypothetical protein